MANQIVAGELYETITGQIFEIGRQLRQKNGYPYDPTRLKQVLQDAIEGIFPSQLFRVYLASGQENGGSMTGFDLERHLEAEGLLKHAYSLEDDLVMGWVSNPSTYPEEFKRKGIFLWKSQLPPSSFRKVAYLSWGDGRVFVHWYWLGYRLDGLNPALLHQI